VTTLFGSTLIDSAATTLGEYLPRFAGAILLLVVGLIVTWLVGRAVTRGLHAAGIDDLGNRHGVDTALARFGIAAPLSRLIGTAIRWALLVVVIVAAISVLGLDSLSASLNAVLLFLPRALGALALVLVGLVLGQFLRERVDAAANRMDIAAPLGPLVEITVVAIFISTALAQLSVPLAIATVIVAILIAAVAFSAALAFGLGSRETARDVAAGRSVANSLTVGSEISFGELRGEIVGFESTATLLRDADGDTMRVPNHLLVSGVVRVHQPGSGQPDAAQESRSG
jgi:small-conductance mechanosensitive channel